MEIARIVPIMFDVPHFCSLMGIELTVKAFTDVLQHGYKVLRKKKSEILIYKYISLSTNPLTQNIVIKSGILLLPISVPYNFIQEAHIRMTVIFCVRILVYSC